MNVGSSSQTPSFFCLTLKFVDCNCKSRPDSELAPVPLNKYFILTPYFENLDEYFLSSIVSRGDLSIEKDVGGSICKDDYRTIVKSLIGYMASQEHEDHSFLDVEVT